MSKLRFVTAAVLAVALSSCSGSSLNPFGNLGNLLGGLGGGLGSQCDPGTQVQLANPTPGQYGVPTNIGQIVIVANGNANNLYNSYSQWNLTLSDQYGNRISSGNLNLIPYSGSKPFLSDFYYSAQIPTLPGGSMWTVFMNESGQSCGVQIGSFST